jgi:hypothetical protein
MMVLRSIAVVFAILIVGQIASGSDQLYRCSDGTFTNRIERQCAPYESTGIVRVQGATAEAATSIVKGEAEQKPLDEVKLFQEPVEHRAIGSR